MNALDAEVDAAVRAANAERMRERQRANRTAGLCCCGKPRAERRAKCERCLGVDRRFQRAKAQRRAA